jgi:cytochrome c oxidase cbb3-type subunit 3
MNLSALKHRPRLVLLGVAGVVLVAIAVASSLLGARLLALQPETVPHDGVLMAYADAIAVPTYALQCAGCHRGDLRGDRARGVPDMTDGDWLYGTGSITDIERTITFGIRSGNPKGRALAVMPGFAHPDTSKEKLLPLTPQDVRDVTEYLFQLEGRPADAAAAARGAPIFANRGACYDCHANDAKGDPAVGAPNLTDNIWLYGDGSRQALWRTITQGRQGSCPAWAGRLRPVVIRALAVMIYARSHSQAPPR